MKFKKVMIGILALSMLTSTAGFAFANDSKTIEPIKAIEEKQEIMPISEVVKKSQFGTFTGEVKETRDFNDSDESQFISLENEDGEIANVILKGDTYVINDSKIEEGSTITAFYDVDKPMIMIYPPQYTAEVITVKNEETENVNIKVDLFDENLLSADNSLKLNVSDDTEIIFKDGSDFEGKLENRKLAVVYDISTRSIPAQTTPIKIIVLSEQIEKDNTEDAKKEDNENINDVSSMDIVVNNEKIESENAFYNEEGTVMVPLRAISESLGFDVTWDNTTQGVKIGKATFINIGEDNYIYMKTAPIQLGTAPELVEGVTYVPLSFFKEVLKMNNAYVFENQIVVDNNEVME